MVFVKKNIDRGIIVIKLKNQPKEKYVLLSGDNQEETSEFYNKLQ